MDIQGNQGGFRRTFLLKCNRRYYGDVEGGEEEEDEEKKRTIQLSSFPTVHAKLSCFLPPLATSPLLLLTQQHRLHGNSNPPLAFLPSPFAAQIALSVPACPFPTIDSRAIPSARPFLLNKTNTRRNRPTCHAVAEGLGLQSPSEEEVVLVPKEDEKGAKEDAEYDWREEWYPLYLTKNVPDDAPLGLTVYHKQLVLYKDGQGIMRCYEDRCPHRLAKLSEGQLVDGKLECLYHGWQFEGDGHCVKIPQLPQGAKIPRTACAKNYEVKDSQGVVWVWMSEKNKPDESKLPWFEHYARPGFTDLSTIHELPYDHSILLENLMDPAHVPISHDRTDWTARREDAQPLVFEVLERSHRGFAGRWWRTNTPHSVNQTRFEAPCVLQNNMEFVDKKGEMQYYSALFLCRPAGQGKSMLIVRFGRSGSSALLNVFPVWFFHQNAGKVFEQDMGFLSSQNEVLIKEKVPTKELYLNLRSSDTCVAEYRKWMDKVGHGMPYHFGHSTISLPKEPAVVEHAPAGLVAGISASFPAKGGFGAREAPNPASRYFRHVVHCKECRGTVRSLEVWKKVLTVVGLACVAAAILGSTRQWKAAGVAAASGCLAGWYVCSSVVSLITTNFVRVHRRL